GVVTVCSLANLVHVVKRFSNGTSLSSSQHGFCVHEVRVSKAEHRPVGMHKISVCVRREGSIKIAIPVFRHRVPFRELSDVVDLKRLTIRPEERTGICFTGDIVKLLNERRCSAYTTPSTGNAEHAHGNTRH